MFESEKNGENSLVEYPGKRRGWSLVERMGMPAEDPETGGFDPGNHRSWRIRIQGSEIQGRANAHQGTIQAHPKHRVGGNITVSQQRRQRDQLSDVPGMHFGRILGRTTSGSKQR